MAYACNSRTWAAEARGPQLWSQLSLYSELAQATQDPNSHNEIIHTKAKVQFNLDELKIKYHGESQICLLRKGRDQAAQPELCGGRSFCGHMNKITVPDQERQQTHWPHLQSWQPNVNFIKERGMGCIQLPQGRMIKKSHPLSYLHLLTRAWGRNEKTKTSSFLPQDPLSIISS